MKKTGLRILGAVLWVLLGFAWRHDREASVNPQIGYGSAA